MNWTVLYSPRALQELTAAWLAAADRQAITAAAHRIDGMLAKDPENAGQLRFDNVRTVVVPPLGVEFEIIDQDRLVWVLTAWDSNKNPPP